VANLYLFKSLNNIDIDIITDISLMSWKIGQLIWTFMGITFMYDTVDYVMSNMKYES